MPGHKWTPEQKAKLAETMRKKHAAAGKGKTAPKAVKAKAAKAPAKKASERKTPSAPAPAQELGGGMAQSYPFQLRELREHTMQLASMSSIPGIEPRTKNAIDAELTAGLELMREQRKSAFGLTQAERDAEEKKAAEQRRLAEEKKQAAAKPAVPPAPPAPEAKAFTPASVPEFRGAPAPAPAPTT